MTSILVNVRNINAPLTGVQRYTRELLAHLGEAAVPIGPHLNARGKLGHAWEQFILPTKLHGRLLWSPGNSGPLAVRNQVVTIHDMAMFDMPDGYANAFSRWYRFLVPRLVPQVTCVLVNSAFTRDRVMALTGVARERIRVIHLGVASRFSPAAADPGIPPRYGIPPGRRFLLSLCSIEPRKNLGRLLDAWRHALPHLPEDLLLVLAGDRGAGHIFAQAQLSLPPRTVVTGRIADRDLPGLMAGAHAFIYPSLYEGFGLPPLEAMASGVPVLASATSAMPEILGDAAMLVDPRRIDQIAGGIVRLCDDATLRRSLTARGRDRAAALPWSRCADRTRDLLCALAERRPIASLRQATVAVLRPTAAPPPPPPPPAWCLIVATLGRDRAVDELLTSLDRQRCRDFAVIILDQNADDRLVPIVARHAGRMAIEHLRMRPQGVSAARNVGLTRLGGARYVAFPDDDCVYEPNTLALATACFERLPSLGALIADHDTPDRLAAPRPAERPGGETRIGLLRRTNTFTLFFRAEAARRIAGFDERLGPGGGTPWLSGEDSDYLIRVAAAGARVLRHPGVRTFHPVVNAAAAGYREKAHGYGRGRIRLLRKNRYPPWVVVLNVALPLVSAAFADAATRRFRWHLFRGRLHEWLRPAR